MSLMVAKNLPALTLRFVRAVLKPRQTAIDATALVSHLSFRLSALQFSFALAWHCTRLALQLSIALALPDTGLALQLSFFGAQPHI